MRKLRPEIHQEEGSESRRDRRVRRKRIRLTEGSREERPREKVSWLVVATRWSLIIGAVLVGLAAGAYILNRSMISAAEANDVAFDSEQWKASGRENIHRDGAARDTRLKMYRDLDDRGLLLGKTRAEVTALLGPGDNYPYFRRPWRACNYWIGPQRGLIPWGSLWLGVSFDKVDRVTETCILTDYSSERLSILRSN